MSSTKFAPLAYPKEGIPPLTIATIGMTSGGASLWTRHAAERYGMDTALLPLTGSGAIKVRTMVRNLVPPAVIDEWVTHNNDPASSGESKWHKAWVERTSPEPLAPPHTWDHEHEARIVSVLLLFGINTQPLRKQVAHILYDWRNNPYVTKLLTFLLGEVTDQSWTQFGWDPFHWMLSKKLILTPEEKDLLGAASNAYTKWVTASSTLTKIHDLTGFTNEYTPMDLPPMGSVFVPKTPTFKVTAPVKITILDDPFFPEALTRAAWIKHALGRQGMSSTLASTMVFRKWVKSVYDALAGGDQMLPETMEAWTLIQKILRIEGVTKVAKAIDDSTFGQSHGCTGDADCLLPSHKGLEHLDFAHRGWRLIGRWGDGEHSVYKESSAYLVDHAPVTKPAFDDVYNVLNAYSPAAVAHTEYVVKVQNFLHQHSIEALRKVTRFHYDEYCAPNYLPPTYDLIEEIGKETGIWLPDHTPKKIVKPKYAKGGFIDATTIENKTIDASMITVASLESAPPDEIIMGGPGWTLRFFVNNGMLDMEFTGSASQLTTRAEMLLSTAQAKLQHAIAQQQKMKAEAAKATPVNKAPNPTVQHQTVAFSSLMLAQAAPGWTNSSTPPPAEMLAAYAKAKLGIPGSAVIDSVYKVQDPFAVQVTFSWPSPFDGYGHVEEPALPKMDDKKISFTTHVDQISPDALAILTGNPAYEPVVLPSKYDGLLDEIEAQGKFKKPIEDMTLDEKVDEMLANPPKKKPMKVKVPMKKKPLPAKTLQEYLDSVNGVTPAGGDKTGHDGAPF